MKHCHADLHGKGKEDDDKKRGTRDRRRRIQVGNKGTTSILGCIDNTIHVLRN